MPTLHFMLPYYQGAHYLKQACLSVAQQTSPEWTLTVLDDAGPDHDAAQVVRSVFNPQQLRTQVRLIRHDTNHGVAATFNHALQLAQDQASGPHDLVTLLGSDDILHPDYCEATLAAGQRAREPFFAIQPHVTVMDADGQPSRPLADQVKYWLRPRNKDYVTGQTLAASLAIGNWLYFPSLAWRITAIKNSRFNTALHTTMDLDFIFDQIAKGRGVLLIGAPLFSYRRHEASVSSQTSASGSRFTEEHQLHLWWSDEFARRGWYWAALCAFGHPTSRLHYQIANRNY